MHGISVRRIFDSRVAYRAAWAKRDDPGNVRGSREERNTGTRLVGI